MSPTAGKLWQGTPISDLLVGKAHAADKPATQAPAPTRNTPRNTPTNNTPTGTTQTSGGGSGFTQATNLSGGGGGNPGGGGNQGPTGPSMADLIEQEFQAAMGFLGGEETRANQQADAARGQVRSEYDASRQNIAAQQEIRNQELDQRRTDVGLDSQQAMTRVKQNLSDLVSRSQAMLASVGGGAANSSLGAAVAERIGRTGAQQAGGVETERVKSLNAINLEGQKLGQFFDEKFSELEMSKNRALNEIGAQLSQRLGQIAGLRAESQINKAKATMQAWQDYSNQVSALRQNVFSLQQQLTSWALEKTNSLKAAQEFALGATPTVNPAQFGIVAPDQAIGTGLGQNIGPMPMTPNGVQVNLRNQGEEDPLQKLASMPMPTTVR